ncbi:tripartite tricarboxylate transporter substrate-binding protein [Bordetella sp. N]|uniref:tripartite tricarboxylate transporter substrate-binding protein n=1 Tax=Bordetella sp. N TaxID=1746199 RepID=UPI000A706AA8|nr:tripartite tricarboxylate transporter substrate-binding protein [Bordetella sp. N]
MKHAIAVAAAFCAAVFSNPSAQAAGDPAKLPDLTKIVVPFSPGASNDVFGRALAAKLAKKLGGNFIVENRPGAGGAIGASEVARAAPDGSTLLFSSVSFVTNAATEQKLPYDAVKSFQPVAVAARGAMLLVVGNETPYTSAAQLIADAKKQSGKLTYGSAGVGSIGQMSAELLNAEAGSNMVHVPYKGITNAVTDMIGGRLHAMITTPASVSGPLDAKKIRPLAVTSLQRSPFYPDLPTVAETVPGYSVDVWWGVYAPAGTPKPLVDKLNAAIREVSAEPEMRALFAREATEPSDMDTAQTTAYVNGELLKWRKLAADRHIVASQ